MAHLSLDAFDDVEDEGTEVDDFALELSIVIPDDEDTQEEGGEEEDSVLDEIINQVALLGSSLSEFTFLEDAIILRIFNYLSFSDVLSCSLVCQNWHKIVIFNEKFWQQQFACLSDPITTYLPMISYYDRYIVDAQRTVERRKSSLVEENILDMINTQQRVETWQLQLLLEAPMFGNSLERGDFYLLELLQQKWVVKGLLDIMLRPGLVNTESDQQLRKLSFQTLASNLLLDEFISDSKLLDVLFFYLETLDRDDQPSVQCSYFSMLVGTLIKNYPDKIVSYCKQHLRVMKNLLVNIHNTHIMEILYKFVDSAASHQWLRECKIMTLLTNTLVEEESEERQEVISEVIINVLTLCHPWGQTGFVVYILNDNQAVETLLDYTMKAPVCHFRVLLGVNIFISVVQLIGNDIDTPLTITHLALHLDFFVNLLHTSNESEVEFAFGKVKLFGFPRLRILELFSSLLSAEFSLVVNQMSALDVFPLFIEIMVAHKWNNIIHNLIFQVFSCLLRCNNQTVVKEEIGKSKLLDHIAEAHASSDSCGYLGHLRELANELLQVATYSPSIAQMMEENDSWRHFVANDLQAWNSKEGTKTDIIDYDEEEDDEENDLEVLAENYEDFIDDYEEYEIDIDDYDMEEYDMEGEY